MWTEPTKNGKIKYVKQYRDFLTGKKKTVSVTLSKESKANLKLASKLLDDKIKEKQSKINTPKDDLTLRELVEKYRAYQKHEEKEATYTRNYFACNTLMKILNEDILINNISVAYIKQCFVEKIKKPGTRNELRTRLLALLRWGYENDLLEDITYLTKFKPFNDTPHKIKIEDKYLEQFQIKPLLNAMADAGCWHWRYLTEFLLLSGLRFGEAVALLDGDLPTNASTIPITKTFDPVNRIVTTPKSFCSIREVYIQPELAKLIPRIRAFYKEQKLECGYKSIDLMAYYADPQLLHGYKGPYLPLFQKRTGDYIEYYSYNKFLKKMALNALGKENVTTHVLRHTHASLLLAQGVSIETISRRLGHDNSQITKEIYLHVTKKLIDYDNAQIAGTKII